MIQVNKSEDLEYIESVLMTDGMAALSGGKPDKELIHEKVHAGDIDFYVAENNGHRLGFVSFKKLDEGIAEIHVALKTRGFDTVIAVTEALNHMRKAGFIEIYAAFSPARKAVMELSDKIGFTDAGTTMYNGDILTIRKLIL
jgi:L-amino acid N-acyltransferase YncA